MTATGRHLTRTPLPPQVGLVDPGPKSAAHRLRRRQPALGVALGIILGVALRPGPAVAAGATATASATIVEPGSITWLEDLRFGEIAASTVAGTVTIAPDTGARTSSGGVALVSGLPTGPAHFLLTGNHFTIKDPDGKTAITLTRSGGTETMVVDTFVRDPLIPPAQGTSADMYVGATLHIGANQAPGFYTGTFNVTMSYN